MLYVKFDHKQELTHRTLAELIAEGDDERPRQLRVKKSGEVRLTHYADHSDLDLYQIAYPTWAPDSNSCGFDAAHDVVWIGQIYRSLHVAGSRASLVW